LSLLRGPGGILPPWKNFLAVTEPAVVVQKAYDWTLWIIPKVEKFPKSYRFSIGQSLVSASTELLLNLVDATYQARNAGSLAAAVREVNRVRYLTRLAKDLHAITVENTWGNMTLHAGRKPGGKAEALAPRGLLLRACGYRNTLENHGRVTLPAAARTARRDLSARRLPDVRDYRSQGAHDFRRALSRPGGAPRADTDSGAGL